MVGVMIFFGRLTFRMRMMQFEIHVGGILIMPIILEQLVMIEFNYERQEVEDDLDKLMYLDKVYTNDDDYPIKQLWGAGQTDNCTSVIA